MRQLHSFALVDRLGAKTERGMRLAATLVACLWFACRFANAQDNAGPLFEPTEVTGDPAGVPASFVRMRLARLDPKRVSQLQSLPSSGSARLLLNLFSNEQYNVVLDRWNLPSPERIVTRGRIEGATGSQVVLSLNKGAVAGSVFLPNRGIFQIQPVTGGLHRIGEMETARLPRCGVQPRSSFTLSSFQLAGSSPAGSQLAAITGDTNVVIDLLVVYTSAARAGAGSTNGMNALIDDAVEEANAAYENSQINCRVRLVYSTEINYRETGNISDDLDHLESGETEYPEIQLVHSLRAQYGADLVCMITENTGGPLGLANLMQEVEVEFSEHAFSIVQRQYANAYQVLAHEIGHNMGCQHDRGTSSGPGAYAFSYAKRFTVSNLTYHTVMAPQPGLPIPYFSNPDVSFLGEPTGVDEAFTNSANNARTINLTAATVARFSTLLHTGTPPRISLTSPTNGAFFLLPAQIQFSATATDDDGQVTEVDFLLNGMDVGEIAQPPYAMIWSNGVPGTYALQARAQDNSGLVKRSTTILFTVDFPPPAFDVSNSRRETDGSFRLRTLGVPGLDYLIEFSPDLSNWSFLGSGIFTDNFFDFLDIDATNAVRRFYRIRRQQ